MFWNRNDDIRAKIYNLENEIERLQHCKDLMWNKFDAFGASIEGLEKKITDLEAFTMAAISQEQNKRIGLGERIVKLEDKLEKPKELK